MADCEAYYGQSGSILFDDAVVATDWYPAPYDTKEIRGFLVSQGYITDVPVDDLEVARRMDVDGTPKALLKAGADGLPADAPMTDETTYLKTLLAILCDEVRLAPKASSTGPEGTIFYCSTDDSVYVGTEL